MATDRLEQVKGAVQDAVKGVKELRPQGLSLENLIATPASPGEYLSRSLRQSSISLTLGVFLGAALSAGLAFGLAAGFFAQEKVLGDLYKRATSLLTSAKDAALATQEGQAVHRAILGAGSSGPLSLAEAVPACPGEEQPAPDLAAALRPGESLPAVAPPAGNYRPVSVLGNTAFLAGYCSRRPGSTERLCGLVVGAGGGTQAAARGARASPPRRPISARPAPRPVGPAIELFDPTTEECAQQPEIGEADLGARRSGLGGSAKWTWGLGEVD